MIDFVTVKNSEQWPDDFETTVSNDVLRLWLASALKGLPISVADETEHVPWRIQCLFCQVQALIGDPEGQRINRCPFFN